MYTISFFPKVIPSLEDVRGWVESFPEGYWHTAESLPLRGVIETDDALVYVDYDENFHERFAEYLDEQEQKTLVESLGFTPRMAIHLQASSTRTRSKELARSLCELLASRWGGASSE